MPGLMHDSDADLHLEDFQIAGRYEQPSLVEGQTIVICNGVLKGASGTVVKRSTLRHYLVSLGEVPGVIVKVPAHLVKAT